MIYNIILVSFGMFLKFKTLTSYFVIDRRDASPSSVAIFLEFKNHEDFKGVLVVFMTIIMPVNFVQKCDI